MKEKGHPFDGPTAPAPSEQTQGSEETSLAAQSGPDSETCSSFISLPFEKFERRAFSNPK